MNYHTDIYTNKVFGEKDQLINSKEKKLFYMQVVQMVLLLMSSLFLQIMYILYLSY